MEHMSNPTKVTFRKLGPCRYAVEVCGALAGSVEKITEGYWSGRYNDGTPAYSADTRRTAAWALINS